ncbi:hypothetical protein ACFW6F_38900 [Streptomyces sp. NPDC058746]|uniref:hypothetical protein n=1 Tax=Streptomyces sp. NPDC058746 TaxID=3346622 RepID=UPI0036CC3F70
MTTLAGLIHHFAALLDPADGNAALLSTWITSAQAKGLPHLHAFTRGLEKDRAAVDAALSCHATTAAPKASTTKPS